MPKTNTGLDQQLSHKTSRCVSTIIKPLRIFQFVRIDHYYFIHCNLNIKEYQNQNELISRYIIKFSLKTVRGAAIVRSHDLYGRCGSYADKRYCLHPLDCPIRRIHFRFSYRVNQPLCRKRLAHYSGNLCRAIVHYCLLKSELKNSKQLEIFL